MLNTERPAFKREARKSSAFEYFENTVYMFLNYEDEFCEHLDNATLAIALIGADCFSYHSILNSLSADRRERILAIISQSHDVTEEDMEAAQRLICDAKIKFDRANDAKNHLFTGYDVNELDDIESLTIPDGILEIEYAAFDGYTYERDYHYVKDRNPRCWNSDTMQPGIQTIVFPDSLKRIEDKAFFNMICLKNIHFGNSLEYVGKFAFYSCGVEKIELPGSIKDIGESAFENCINLESVKLSEGIEAIPEEMFLHCTALREVILPSTIKEIGKLAFWDCCNLVKIDLPEGLTIIAKGLFGGCGSLEEIYIPKSVTQIEDDAFGSGWEGWSCEEDLVITCHQDSFAHQYAIENNLKFKLITL